MSMQQDGPPFTGTSPDETISRDEKPDLSLAIDRAAEKAAQAGYAGQPFNLSVVVVPKEKNQWIRTYQATLSE